MGLHVRWDLLSASGNVTSHCASRSPGTFSSHGHDRGISHANADDGSVDGDSARGKRTEEVITCTATVASKNHNTFPTYREREMLAFLAAQTSDTACWD